MSDFDGHTPAPWFLDDDGDIRAHDPEDPNYPWIVGMACRNVGHGKDQSPANARLIAAAPDLLAERDRLAETVAELVEALEQIAHMGHDAPATFAGDDANWERHRAALMQRYARAALAKAREKPNG